MSQAAAKIKDAPLPMFTRSLADADPAVDAGRATTVSTGSTRRSLISTWDCWAK